MVDSGPPPPPPPVISQVIPMLSLSVSKERSWGKLDGYNNSMHTCLKLNNRMRK
jgi:hypothetical protein